MFSRLLEFLSACSRRKYPAFFLAFCWFAGLLCGWELFRISGISSNLPISEWTVAVSPGELVIRVLVPFLICLIGLLLDQHWLIYGCAFLKAVLFSFVSVYTVTAFGSGGWLIRFLFLFTDTLMCAIWYVFWQDCLSGRQISLAKALSLCAAGLFFAGLDLRMVTPLLMRLINA